MFVVTTCEAASNKGGMNDDEYDVDDYRMNLSAEYRLDRVSYCSYICAA